MAEPAPEKGIVPPWSLLHLAALVFMGAGAIGMFAGFHYLSLADSRDIAAGSAGFVAGAVLTGSGLISLSILSHRKP
jgi:hypothetical protein